MSQESIMEFPCDFPIKVMGHHTEEFQDTVVEIIARHIGSRPLAGTRPSRDKRYIALSFNIRATSREQLDAIYKDLTACELVLFAL